MSAPFFDRSGVYTVFPGDSVIVDGRDGRRKRAFLRRVFMDVYPDGRAVPSGEVSSFGEIYALPCDKMVKCVRWFGEDYASVSALNYEHMPVPGSNVLVWSLKKDTYVNARVVAIDDDVSLISYKGQQFEVPTHLVHISVMKRKVK